MRFSFCLFTFLSMLRAGCSTSAKIFTKIDDPSLHLQTMKPNPKPYKISYDDGTQSPLIQIKIRGDETSSPNIYEETLDGYTVGPSNKHKGKYTYRDVDIKTGDLVDTDLVAGYDNPASKNVLKKAAVKSEAMKKGISYFDFDKVGGNDRKLKGSAPRLLSKENNEEEGQYHRRAAITSGVLKNLVVPFRFSDHTSRALPSRSDLTVLMNNVGPASQCPTGSVRDVYLQSSFNQLDIQSTVVEWVTLDFTEAYCANGNSGLTTRIHECLTNALDKAAAAGVNFGEYDEDNNGFIDGITFFHSGYAAEWGGNDAFGTNRSDRIWSHKWAIYTTNWNNNGVRVYEYHINPSLWSTSGSNIGRIGVVAHETGHFLGLPDLYDYGDPTYGDGEGIGSWGLMANSWGFDGSQLYPPHMSAWSKYVLGWVNPTVVTSPGTYQLGQACDNDDAIIISQGYPNGEYLLIENRQPCGFETRMGQGGLTIFHIDSNANNIVGYPQQSGWPTNGNHYIVALLQADSSYGLERSFNRGDVGDMFHAGGVNSIGPSGTSNGATYPNTKAYQGGNIVDTEVTISNIGAAGPIMTFDITIGSQSVSPSSTPIASPSVPPSVSPSVSPSVFPNVAPSVSPSVAPSASSSVSPSASPSASPSVSPSDFPSISPSISPSASPSISLSVSPSDFPSVSLSVLPSDFPSVTLSSRPTASPNGSSSGSMQPSSKPFINNSSTPSATPSVRQSSVPSSPPSIVRSEVPSFKPTAIPSLVPTTVPSMISSFAPSVKSSLVPSDNPSTNSSSEPTSTPSFAPSTKPSEGPSSVPNTAPSGMPSISPVLILSSAPTSTPTSTPTYAPSEKLSSTPSSDPSPMTFSTISPSESPSRPRTTSPSSSKIGTCKDFPNFFRVIINGRNRRRTCIWVSDNTNRCNFHGVKETCPFTCGTCSICADSPLKLRFVIAGRNRNRRCTWAARNSERRCELVPVLKIGCRETCGAC